eukprot:794385-Prymnesium_polylepis.1
MLWTGARFRDWRVETRGERVVRLSALRRERSVRRPTTRARCGIRHKARKLIRRARSPVVPAARPF